MEVSGNGYVLGRGGGDMEVGNVGSGVPRPPSPSQPRPCPPSRPRPHRSTLPLPLPRMGCIQTRVDDIGGLMDGPCEVDAS